jgi:hypothetical protein
MNPYDHQQHGASSAARGMALWRWAQGGLIAAGLAMLVVACGGGVGSGGTGAYASGPVEGLRLDDRQWQCEFDDTFASVVDGDGAPRTRDDAAPGHDGTDSRQRRCRRHGRCAGQRPPASIRIESTAAASAVSQVRSMRRTAR